MTKAGLRKLYLEKRLALPEASYVKWSEQLCQQFFLSTDLSNIKVLHTFLPLLKFREPDTFHIIHRINQEFPSIKLSIPRVNTESGTLENYFWEGENQLGQNKWGLSEPQYGTRTSSEVIDLILVPLLAFDLMGHRVGYGKGYYDRFLSACRKDCKKIGLSFFQPIERIDTIEEHDLKLDQVITPEKSYLF